MEKLQNGIRHDIALRLATGVPDPPSLKARGAVLPYGSEKGEPNLELEE
jgi:hypothetical protein